MRKCVGLNRSCLLRFHFSQMAMVGVGNVCTNLLWGVLSDNVGRKVRTICYLPHVVTLYHLLSVICQESRKVVISWQMKHGVSIIIPMMQNNLNSLHKTTANANVTFYVHKISQFNSDKKNRLTAMSLHRHPVDLYNELVVGLHAHFPNCLRNIHRLRPLPRNSRSRQIYDGKSL